MNTFIPDFRTYIHVVIAGIETVVYKMVFANHPDKIAYMAMKTHPFLNIFAELHTSYFRETNNSLVCNDNPDIMTIFNALCNHIPHSKKCILTIVSNLIVSIHFNLERENLNWVSLDAYIKCIHSNIDELLFDSDIIKLFDHECDQTQTLGLLGPDENFIDISIDKKTMK